jgi:hypothetical protein
MANLLDLTSEGDVATISDETQLSIPGCAGASSSG